jgi:hypothetical protein
MASEIEKLLVTDHSELDLLLQRTFEAMESGDAELTYRKLDLFWARLAMHIRSEHLHLFPALLKLSHNPGAAGLSAEESIRIQELIELLHDDHDYFMRQLLAVIKTMRAAQGPLDDETEGNWRECRSSLETVRDRLAVHNTIEELEAYPMAARLLSIRDQKELAERLSNEITNLPPRHRLSREQLQGNERS